MASHRPLLCTGPVARVTTCHSEKGGRSHREVNDGELVVMAISPKVGQGKGKKEGWLSPGAPTYPSICRREFTKPLAPTFSSDSIQLIIPAVPIWVSGGPLLSPSGSHNLWSQPMGWGTVSMATTLVAMVISPQEARASHLLGLGLSLSRMLGWGAVTSLGMVTQARGGAQGK